MGAEKPRLNAKVYNGLMCIEGAPLYHMADDVTRFTSESIWETIHTF